MDYNSLIFLFVFLPISLAVFYLCKRLSKNNKTVQDVVLLFFSFVFYTYKAGFLYFGILLASVILHYGTALVMHRLAPKVALDGCCATDGEENSKASFPDNKEYVVFRNAIFITDICLSVVVLLFFKYCGIFDFGKSIVFPLALSFITFSQIAFSVDVYKKNIDFEKVSALSYFLYVFLFIKLTQGPIVPYNKLETCSSDFINGIRRFCMGISKKVLIADVLGTIVSTALANIDSIGTVISWLALLCFALQLFFDFSGYTDMAIGIGLMFGYKIPENFNAPYISKSITEFWRRWHITLGAWFKNYIYIPLGGNRKGKLRTVINLLIVFILTGIWHGSAITFLLWGLYFGAFMLMERLFLNKWLDKNPIKIINWLYTFTVVVLSWVLFVSGDLDTAGQFFKNLFTSVANTSEYSLIGLLSLKVTLAFIIGFISAVIMPILVRKFFMDTVKSDVFNTVMAGIGVILLIICIVFITNNSFMPSIYGGF